MQFSTISSLDEFPETARLLGNLTVSWSHAERAIYLVFWAITGTTQGKAFDIYENITSFRTRYDLTAKLLEESLDEHPKMQDLLSCLNSLIACFQIRNELVHRTWVTYDNKKLGLIDHRMKKKQGQVRSISDKEIRDTIRLINQTCDKIIHAILEIYPHAFQKTS
ncbi:hypothetical protein [Hyphomicrobium sp. 802]|uniref:hypothetical protein n=1 Tax=Hyphomicrobium sp. 802 TaxID=1112272 RepID=UPI0012DDFA78|nr:hypothetical protein [Hyphomicrobium sp. 802]